MGYCKKCGLELNNGANFCPNCGESTSQSSVVSQDGKVNEVIASSKPQVQRVNSTHKKTKVAHKRKKKEPIHYDWWVKIALVIGGCLLIYSLFDISNSSIILWGANILGCVSILYAIAMILLGKSEIDNQGAKMLAVVSLLWLPVLKGLDYLVTADAKNSVENFSDFSDVLPTGGGQLFIAEETKPYSEKNITIKSIMLFERNDERDYQLDGATSSGRYYTEKGKWMAHNSEVYQAVEYNFTHLWDYNLMRECKNYYIDENGYVYYCAGITPSGEDVAKAFKKGAIAKLRVATEAEAEDWRQRKESGEDSNSAITIKPDTPEEKDYAEKGYNDGAEFGAVGGLMGGFGGMLDLADAVGVTEDEMEVAIRNSATRTYDEKFESPTSSKQERLKEIYIQHYIEGFKSKTKASND